MADTRDRLTRIRHRAALDVYRPYTEDVDYLLSVIHLMERQIEALTLAALDPDNYADD